MLNNCTLGQSGRLRLTEATVENFQKVLFFAFDRFLLEFETTVRNLTRFRSEDTFEKNIEVLSVALKHSYVLNSFCGYH